MVKKETETNVTRFGCTCTSFTSRQPRPYHGDGTGAIPEIQRTPTDVTESTISESTNASSRPPKEPSSAGTKKKKASPKDEMQELMQDNLDLMLEIVLRIREDPDFASNIYNECPRLQHMLDQHLDLRPLFEDPKLVRINFEEVYKKSGGVLPEDQKPKTLLQRFVQSPIFKVLKVFLFLKKIISCVMSGGVAIGGAMFAGLFGGQVDIDGDNDGGDHDADIDEHESESKVALDQAADRMEDQETRERMSRICEENDPQKLLEEIEDNPDLKALRDANPLCAELMSDPETMKILVDPDNLRALGDAGDLIEQDFANPDWSPDALEDIDVDTNTADLDGGVVDSGAGEPDIESDNFADAQEEELAQESTDALEEDVAEEEDAPEEVDEEAGEEEGEDGDDDEEEEEEEGMEYEHGEDEIEDDKKKKSANKGAQKKAPPKQKQKNERKDGGGMANFMGNLRTGLTDMVAVVCDSF